MDKPDLKTAAESVLRELPAVVGAFVQPDAFGRPREIHLLINAGIRPRDFAEHVKEVLEERLRVPIDQRIISIAQIAAVPQPAAAGPSAIEAPAVVERVRLEQIESATAAGRITVRARLVVNGESYEGEATELESDGGRSRAAAAAVLAAINGIAGSTGRFSLDFATSVVALDAQYVLVSATVASVRLGRRTERVVGAHPVEDQSENAAALAALKAVNRVLQFVLHEGTERERPPRFTR